MFAVQKGDNEAATLTATWSVAEVKLKGQKNKVEVVVDNRKSKFDVGVSRIFIQCGEFWDRHPPRGQVRGTQNQGDSLVDGQPSSTLCIDSSRVLAGQRV